MRIEVVRTGGFAGIERRAEVDTGELGPAEAAAWEELARVVLTEAGGEDADPDPGPVRDGFAYRLVLDGRTLVRREPGLTEHERLLITRALKEGA
ncbi:protealysin inhibitor emfourin [Streptomyces sp. BI20]|uniref:protealysin inhibitor emfourin n=1 Tax=Streptomyces sp. BI20 TaxID=3403460 RepID=UPI003C7430A7